MHSYFPSFADDWKATTFFDQRVLKTVVSIEEKVFNKAHPIGTGFIVNKDINRIFLVTAKHVILDENNKIKESLLYRINLKNGQSVLVSNSDLQKSGFGNWFFLNDSDVAVRVIDNVPDGDIITIPFEKFIGKDEISPGTPALILGFPMGLRSEKFTKPIVRKAMVALVDNDLLLIDGFVFPGNSGGPIFYMPSFQVGGIKLKNYVDDQRLIGLVSSYIPYSDTAISTQTKRPRITFEENSGLTIGIPSNDIISLINSLDFENIRNTPLK